MLPNIGKTNPSQLFAKANNFFAAIEDDIQSGVQGGEAAPAAANEAARALLEPARAPADEAGADVAASDAPALHELRERLAASQQQCKKLEHRLGEKSQLCADKDSQLAAVLEEGETLSKRQAEQEKVIRQLKQELREAQAVGENATAEAEELRQRSEDAARERREASVAQGGAREEALAEATGKAESLEQALQSERSALVALRAQHATLQEEVAARQLETAQRREHDASVADSMAELQMENAKLVAMARLREEGLSSQVEELQARSDAAQAHVSQLGSGVTQATKPLLRQIGALQQQQQQMQQAWRQTEVGLQQRIASAEASAAAAEQRERELRTDLGSAHARQQALETQLRAAEERGVAAAAQAAETAKAEAAREAAALRERLELARKQQEQAAARELGAAKEEAEAQRHAAQAERDAARDARDAHAEELRQARQEARSQLAAARASSSPLPLKSGRGSGGAAASSLLLPNATPTLYAAELERSRERREEGRLAELQELARQAEVRHHALVEQLAAQATEADEMRAELVRLRRTAAELRTARDEHSMALEMLGEKQEELDAKQEELDALRRGTLEVAIQP